MNRKLFSQIGCSMIGVVIGVGITSFLRADELKVARCSLSELGSVVYMETSGYVSPNYAEFQQAAHGFYACAGSAFEEKFDTNTMLEPVDFR